jgi:cobalt/nickel transport system permease protein
MRVPDVFIMIISFMYRYIFVLTDDVMRMKQARDSRNFGVRRRWQMKTIGNMIGALFVRSYERGERVYAAMLSRGYDGRTRTLKELRLNAVDLIFGAALSGMLVFSGVWIYLVR